MEKRIIHKREEFFDTATVGHVYIDGEPFCWSLEDTVREEKVYAKTAIPYGIYDVRIINSQRFGEVIQLYNKPDFSVEGSGMRFTGILVHGGNDVDDTAGCPLVAYNRTGERTIQGAAHKAIRDKVKSWIAKGHDVKWEITK